MAFTVTSSRSGSSDAVRVVRSHMPLAPLLPCKVATYSCPPTRLAPVPWTPNHSSDGSSGWEKARSKNENRSALSIPLSQRRLETHPSNSDLQSYVDPVRVDMAPHLGQLCTALG